MSQYPLVSQFMSGLYITLGAYPSPTVSAEDLEAELAKGFKMYSSNHPSHVAHISDTISNSRYECLVIGYQPIEQEKPVTKAEILEVLEMFKDEGPMVRDLLNLIERISKQGSIT